MHKSIATIDSPEFINLQPLDINPLMSSCEIKVLYLGENRNHSYITKEVATDMAKSLRGAPIVGYYNENKQDFSDHGQRVIMDDEGIKFDCLTKPYGFVAPDAKVWFQNFEDTDDFGNVVTREYMMTTGYLWTGQFEECKDALNGKPQSMELDENTLDGHWSTNNKTGMDFFIINDAIFSKLCILGDDVEPCFEGAAVTAPDVSTSFTLVDDSFKNTLYTMMQELTFALKGGRNMENGNVIEDSLVKEEEAAIETPEVVEEPAEEVVPTVEEEVVEENDKIDESNIIENQESIEVQSNQDTFAKKEDEEEKPTEEDGDKEEEKSSEDSKKESESGDKEEKDSEEDKDEEEKKKYSLLEENYASLESKYTELESKYQALVEFKKAVDNEKKDALINSFYMLSDEDKADVIANKENYSLDDIEAKLSIICVRKKVNFDLEKETSNEVSEDASITTYSLNSEKNAEVPAWISALRNTQKEKQK